MKTKNKLYLLAVGAAALALNVSTGSGQVFSPADAANNRAIAASPRMLEQFPELARSAEPSETPVFNIAPLAEKNTAILSSPRMRELYPALSRRAAPGTAKGGASKLMEPGK